MASNSDLAPISWASTIIGFISFAFTVSTFVKVIAGNLATIASAPQEAPFVLSNLKQELFEERVHLRRVRRRAERYMRRAHRDGRPIPSWDAAPTIRLMEATVRQLCRQFRDLERPFLIDRRDRGVGGGRAGMPPKAIEEAEKAGADDWDNEADDYMETGFHGDYGTVTLYHRFSWLRRKNDIMALSAALERVQIRRIGRETTDTLAEIKALKGGLADLRLIPAGSDGGGGGGGGGGAGGFDRGPGGGGGGGGHGHGHGHAHGHTHSGGGGGSRRRRSYPRGRRRDEEDGAESDSSESSRSDNEKDLVERDIVERDRVERIHVRRSSRHPR